MLQDRTDNEMCSREEELSFDDLYDVSFLLEDDVLVDLCALPDEPEEELDNGSSNKLMELSKGHKRKSSAEAVMQGVKLVRESNISEAVRSLNQAIQNLDSEVSQCDTEPDEESSPIDDVVNPPAVPEETAIDISVFDCPINAKYRAVLRMLSNSVLPEEQCLTELLQESILRNRLLPNVAPVGRQRRLCATTGKFLGYTGRIVVVGDLHGQYRDLRALLLDPSVGGMPCPENAYVFNGDLVDRGDMSVEILIALLVAQSINPQNIVILRGNHETERVYKKHGFSTEVLRKYSAATLALFQRLFQSFPFAAVIEDSVFVCHGGLGPQTHKMTIAEINGLDRFCEPRSKSAMFEIMWCGEWAECALLRPREFLGTISSLFFVGNFARTRPL